MIPKRSSYWSSADLNFGLTHSERAVREDALPPIIRSFCLAHLRTGTLLHRGYARRIQHVRLGQTLQRGLLHEREMLLVRGNPASDTNGRVLLRDSIVSRAPSIHMGGQRRPEVLRSLKTT